VEVPRIATPRAATALAAVAVLMLVGAIPLSESSGQGFGASAFGLALLVGSLLAVGVIVARTGNPIGWTLLWAAFFFTVEIFASAYTVDNYRAHHQLPLAPVAVFVQPTWAPAIFLFALTLFLFPDGKLPSGRWRRAVGIVGAVGAIWMIGAFAIAAETIALSQVAIEPGGDLYRIDHPTSGWTWWPIAQDAFFIGLVSLGLAWFVSLVPAYRSATGERRQQLKWLICGGSVACVGGVLTVVLGGQSGVLGVIGRVAVIGLLGMPIAIGVGITKYRLYEIDRLISRTLSYTLLTGALLAVFGGLVLLTTRVLPFSSPVGVAASTLAAAALFNPLRRGLERWVDRRFNRARYDADALVGAFSSRLRNAVDLDTVQSALLETASRAVEPAHVSVWLRE
jgi:hypothetical protein